MKIIDARNVCEAYHAGVTLLHREGVLEQTRNGPALVCPEPVTTVYRQPVERVLFADGRVANPVFHLMESLWMLAGRDDATFLDEFVGDFSSRYAEPDGVQYGAYGARWRLHFPLLRGGRLQLAPNVRTPMDQLREVIGRLREDPQDRRVVIQMWDPEADLGADVRDVPCNVTALPRVVDGRLDLTVLCRSNDAVWGAYGANAVHFSVLQEYLAAGVGVAVGVYRQVSNNLHVYTDQLARTGAPARARNPYQRGAAGASLVRPTPLVLHWESFDEELHDYISNGVPPNPRQRNYATWYLASTLRRVNYLRKARRWSEAKYALAESREFTGGAADWALAAAEWLVALESKKEG